MSHDSNTFLDSFGRRCHWEHNTSNAIDLYIGAERVVAFGAQDARVLAEQALFLLDLYNPETDDAPSS